MTALLNVPFNVISTPDFYVFVTDNMQNLLEAMKQTVALTSSWNPSAKFIILFNNLEHRRRMGDWDADKAFQEIAIRFHVNHICLLFASGARSYDIYVSRLFLKAADGQCGEYLSFKVDTICLVQRYRAALGAAAAAASVGWCVLLLVEVEIIRSNSHRNCRLS